ncbi:hypothetical protein ASA1KI_27870 [Opitutales bacterium ASA1]|nr:hypothetical protein ASA1KI_27870 [Opitutales bacterium ASA1]
MFTSSLEAAIAWTDVVAETTVPKIREAINPGGQRGARVAWCMGDAKCGSESLAPVSEGEARQPEYGRPLNSGLNCACVNAR